MEQIKVLDVQSSRVQAREINEMHGLHQIRLTHFRKADKYVF